MKDEKRKVPPKGKDEEAAKSAEKMGNKYQPPVRLPLEFDQAVKGLLGVKPQRKGGKK